MRGKSYFPFEKWKDGERLFIHSLGVHLRHYQSVGRLSGGAVGGPLMAVVLCISCSMASENIGR